MFIEEIIIDGFKSYAHRTTIEGFDPHFNAITGLNGSGKSNILDAICFVLGITNLSTVRAGNLSELVYKQGQAGVHQASVSIVFDNSDPTNCPVGYETVTSITVTRQIVLLGKSKYWINGRVAPKHQIESLFQSVQLNVNNPHFLIMQGRITQVLNASPADILGLLEEAAGTRLYERKRVTALSVLEKKELKVQELNSILQEEITPTLERLRSEKQAYLEYSKTKADLDRLDRLVLAWDFTKATQAVEKHAAAQKDLQTQVQTYETKERDCDTELSSIQMELDKKSAQLKGDFQAEHQSAKNAEDDCSKKLVQITSTWQSAQSNLLKADTDLNDARAALKDAKATVTDHHASRQAEADACAAVQDAARKAEARLGQLQTDFTALAAGLTTAGQSLPEQMSQAHGDANRAQAKVEQATMKIEHLSKELKNVEKDIKKEGKSAAKLEEKRDKASQKVEKLKSDLDQLSFNPDDFASMEEQKTTLESSVADLQDLVDTLSARLEGRLRFQYSDPVRGFDRSKVKGIVAKLVKVRDAQHSTALEVVAGGKLYQVVVDEAITGKALLNNGKLERRVTIIPLDKIQPRTIPQRTSQHASQVAESLQSRSSPAIELVGFDEDVRTAMEYVFGSTLVVDGAKAANLICDQTKTRTVTLEGDVYDPSGTISGGSNNQLGTTLSKLTELTQASAELEVQQRQLQHISTKLSDLQAAASSFEKTSAQLDFAQAELAATLQHLAQTSFGVLVEKRDQMTEELASAKTERSAMEQEQKDKFSLYEQLCEQEAELTQERENRIGAIEREIEQAKKEVAAKNDMSRRALSQTQTMALELESLEAEVVAAEEGVSLAERAAVEAAKEEADLQIQVGEIRAKYEEARAALESMDEKVAACSSEMVDLKRKKSDWQTAKEQARLEAKRLTVAFSKMEKDRVHAAKTVTVMLQKFKWIDSDKSAFGVEGGDYDFASMNFETASKQLKQLKSDKESMEKKINQKVIGMIEKAEGEYTELLRKRKVVENDKKKICAVIEELDVKKKVELQRTWVKVNRDFGSIFTTLLPGASAKIEPPEGMEAWEGLEIKVAFGEVWKESLSELSGGQRSLLALSLILSLLLFKPAPMYILDEVDAALDLSHTQNIGNMLKTHFSQSQFVVVSLKEGMFNNANVIFRTKFVDGVSTVTRTIGTGSSRARPLTESNETEESLGFGGRTSSRKAATSGSSRSRRGKENST